LKGRAAVNPHAMGFGWQLWAGEHNNRDLKFYDRMLKTIRKHFAVDDRRIYAAGFSNGAIFCYVLWAKRAKTLAAIGPVAACLSSHLPKSKPTKLSQPLPVMHIAGLMDPKIRLEWQAATIHFDLTVNHTSLTQGEKCGDCCVLYQSSGQPPVKARFWPGGHEVPSFASKEFVEFFKAHKQP